MKKILNRLREPSTWAGVAGLTLAVAPFLPPPWNICAHGTAAVTGWLAMQLTEKGPTP